MREGNRWGVGRIKWDATMAAGATPPTDDLDLWLDGDDPGGTPFVAIADMSRRERVTSTAKSLSPEGLASRGMPIGEPGTLLFAMYASVGEVAFLDRRATWNQALLGITPNPEKIDSRFLRYVLLNMKDELLREVRSNTQANLNAGQVGNIWFQRPKVEEQRAIADYLDRETARIDTLIQEQQRLIELLRERRSALISHAVLDVTSKRTQLRRLVDVIDCAHVTAEFVDGHERFPVASIRECQGPTVDLSACAYTTAEFFNHLRSGNRAPRTGDLLFIRNVSVGLVSVVPPELPEFAMGQETVLLRRKSEVDPEFLRYVLIGAEARHEIEGAMIGSTFRRINVSAIRSLPVAIPPISEQRRIAALLDEQTAQIDELVAEAERFIELSRERRAALITAAVTGQIDVREVA